MRPARARLALVLATAIGTGAVRADEPAAALGQYLRRAASEGVDLERMVAGPRRPAETGPRGGWVLQSKAYIVRTPDEWKIVLRRYRLPDRTDPRQPPVVLCPSMESNSWFFDLRPRVSLAAYLAQAGFDVWCVDLRGQGMSSKWSPRPAAAQPIERAVDLFNARSLSREGFASSDPKFDAWTLDHQADRDVGAVLGFVCHETGYGQVAWIGHSTGALVLFGYLGRYGVDRRIGRVVSVGCALSARPGSPHATALGAFLRPYAEPDPARSSGDSPRARAGLLGLDRSRIEEDVLEALLADASETPSAAAASQWLAIAQTGEVRSVDGGLEYFEGARATPCPTLILAGVEDPFASAESQVLLLERLAALDKTLLFLGKESGLSVDYGYADPLVGRAAAEEVFPILARWLRGSGIGKPRSGDRAAPSADSSTAR